MLRPTTAPYLQDIEGKRVIVLHFGDALVMLSCAKRGAIVTGVDFSEEQVRLAKTLAQECGVNVDLFQADCQDSLASFPAVAAAEEGITTLLTLRLMPPRWRDFINGHIFLQY